MFAHLLALSLGVNSPHFPAAPLAAPPEAESLSSSSLGRLHELEAAVRPIADRLLACTSKHDFLTAMDVELLRPEPLSRFLPFVLELGADELTATLAAASSEPNRALNHLVAVTSPAHRDELARGFRDAARIASHIFRPENPHLAQLREAIAERPEALLAEVLSELGRPGKPLTERYAELASLRSNICAFVLATASDTGSRLPPWMADLCVQLWRQGQEQILALLEHQPAPPLREECLTPLSSVLLSFSCHEPDLLARAFDKHPTLAPLLKRIGATLPRYFEPSSIKSLRLRPPPGADTSPDDTVLVDILVDEHDTSARLALDRFDEEWWFEAFRESTAEIVVDLRRV